MYVCINIMYHNIYANLSNIFIKLYNDTYMGHMCEKIKNLN